MGYRASRPIVVEVSDVTGIVYVPIAREREEITIQSGATALTGIEVAFTLDNIIRGKASSYDQASEGLIDKASATWTILEGNIVTTQVPPGSSLQAYALRFTPTGTGVARVVIQQEG